MHIKAISNGWLVTVNDNSMYIGGQSDEHFCATKDDVVKFIYNHLKTNLELRAEIDAVRKKEMEERAVYQQIGGLYK